MSAKIATTSDTEAEFEAEIRAAIERAFPLLNPAEIKHQTTFTFKFGHSNVTVDGKRKDTARSRADVLLLHQGTPLAVFELKRSNIGLTEEDERQGLSYARLLDPWPPFVVVTNGRKTVFLETFSGKPCKARTKSAQDVQELIANASRIADEGIKNAIHTLMGTDPNLWMAAIRAKTKADVNDLTGRWRDVDRPFVDGFLLPRNAAKTVVTALENGRRTIAIAGAPLSGKSNLLREVIAKLEASPAFAVMLIDANTTGNFFQLLADWLAAAVAWMLTADEARGWLRNLSRSGGPALVVAIDNIQPENVRLMEDINALVSETFGPGARVIVAADDAVIAKLRSSSNHRSLSLLSRNALFVPLPRLDDEEFGSALSVLKAARMAIMRGGTLAPEYRRPWVLRAICGETAESKKYRDAVQTTLPPLIGPELLELARSRFNFTRPPFSLLREVSLAFMTDARAGAGSPEMTLQRCEAFAVMKTTLRDHLSDGDIGLLVSSGLLREARIADKENAYVVRFPELLASEVAKLLAQELTNTHSADPEAGAGLLAGLAACMPLGDIVAAQALLDTASKPGGMNVRVINELLRRKPRQQKLNDGSFLWKIPEGPFVEMEVRRKEPGEDDTDRRMPSLDEHSLIEDFLPWLILSHLVAHPFEVLAGDERERGDYDLLLKLLTCPLLLTAAGADLGMAGVRSYKLSDGTEISCNDDGIVEPMTLALLTLLSREQSSPVEALIDYALAFPNAARLSRFDAALSFVADLPNPDPDRGTWAAAVRHEKIAPALSAVLDALPTS
jgi:hypothetical protein